MKTRTVVFLLLVACLANAKGEVKPHDAGKKTGQAEARNASPDSARKPDVDPCRPMRIIYASNFTISNAYGVERRTVERVAEELNKRVLITADDTFQVRVKPPGLSMIDPTDTAGKEIRAQNKAAVVKTEAWAKQRHYKLPPEGVRKDLVVVDKKANARGNLYYARVYCGDGAPITDKRPGRFAFEGRMETEKDKEDLLAQMRAAGIKVLDKNFESE